MIDPQLMAIIFIIVGIVLLLQGIRMVQGNPLVGIILIVVGAALLSRGLGII